MLVHMLVHVLMFSIHNNCVHVMYSLLYSVIVSSICATPTVVLHVPISFVKLAEKLKTLKVFPDLLSENNKGDHTAFNKAFLQASTSLKK